MEYLPLLKNRKRGGRGGGRPQRSHWLFQGGKFVLGAAVKKEAADTEPPNKKAPRGGLAGRLNDLSEAMKGEAL